MLRTRRDGASGSAQRARLIELARRVNPSARPERWSEGDRSAALVLHDALLEAHDVFLPTGRDQSSSMYPAYDARTRRYYSTLAHTYANDIRLAMNTMRGGEHVRIWFSPTKLAARKDPLIHSQRYAAPNRLPAGAVIVFDTRATEAGRRMDAWSRAQERQRHEDRERAARIAALYPTPPPPRRSSEAQGPSLSLSMTPGDRPGVTATRSRIATGARGRERARARGRTSRLTRA